MKIFHYLVIFAAMLSATASQAKMTKKQLMEIKKDYVRPKEIPYPEENPYSKKKVTLGKMLFFDPILSGSKFISCATCHNPGLGFEDGMDRGLGNGMKQLGRHTPTVLNLAWGETFFWDGRAGSLEEQALGPIKAAGEMNLPHNVLIKRLNNIPGYVSLFKKVFPNTGVTTGNIGKAIATFERTLVSGIAPFDRWINGKENAISESAKRGFDLFNNKANCVACHSGWNFTDDSFHDIGLKGKDIGRAKIVPGVKVLEHAFKTPGLRNITRRAPYMHNGTEATLTSLVSFYNKGGDVNRKSKSDLMKKLKLSKREISDIVVFLNTLTGPIRNLKFPVLPRR